MIFLVILLLSAITALLYVYLTWHKDYFENLGVPYVKPTLFFGNTPNLVLQKRNAYYDIEEIFHKFRGKYRFCGLFSFRRPTILVLDASLAREILVTQFNKFSSNEHADLVDKKTDPILGYNPFVLNGAEWREKRAEVTPVFTVSRLRAMYPLIEDVCQNLSAFIDKESRIVGSGGIDTRDLFTRYTADVVSNCIFALDARSLKDETGLIHSQAKKLFAPNLLLIIPLMLNELSPTLVKYIRIPFVPKQLVQFFTRLMKDAVELRKKSNVDRADVLQFIIKLQEKKNLNDVELMASALTFFLDGYETSSVSMSLITFEIARSKRVQDKLRAEIRAAEEKGPLTMEAISELPFLDQVLHEAMRLNTPFVLSNKRCVEDCELALTDEGGKSKMVTIKAGTAVYIPLMSIHRDPDNYKDPLEFIPERFDAELGGVKAYKDKGKLLMFGDGPRICLGMRFAITQIKAGLVRMLKDFELSVNEKTKVPLVIDPAAFLNDPVGKVWVDFKRL